MELPKKLLLPNTANDNNNALEGLPKMLLLPKSAAVELPRKMLLPKTRVAQVVELPKILSLPKTAAAAAKSAAAAAAAKTGAPKDCPVVKAAACVGLRGALTAG